MECPCGSGTAFEACCQPAITGVQPAPTAEALMRSRYTAYVQGAFDYLIETHHPQTRASMDRDGAREWSEGAEWLGLQILDTVGGGADDDEGIVEFAADFLWSGDSRRHRERSRFNRIDRRWYYLDAEKEVHRAHAKVGRNAPCPCGSGRKFKRCCAKR